MDENQYVTDELQRLQSNITSLFKSLIIEKNKCNYEKEKTLSSVESLLTEIKNLKRENEELRKSNSALKTPCESCSELKQKLVMQDRKSMRLEQNLNMIREFLKKVPYKNFTPASFSKLLIMQLDDAKSGETQTTELQNASGYVTGQDESSQSEEELIMYDTIIDGTPSIRNCRGLFAKKTGELSSRGNEKQAEGKCDENCNRTSPSCSEETRKTPEMVNEFQTPKKIKRVESDGSRGRDEETKKTENSPILLKEQRSTAGRQPFPNSPIQLKRKASEDASSLPGMEKRLFLKSPMKKFPSPAKGSRSKSTSHLKGTNSIEAEISLSGVRRLKQTQLNLDYYKSKGQDVNNENAENVNVNEQDINQKLLGVDDSKFEDDLILESPRNFDRLLDGVKKNESAGNHSKSDLMEDIDPDETFVSPNVLQERIKQEPKESSSDKETRAEARQGCISPEYNSVPYLYKGSPVRKKSERMKIPGQMCMECNKYYKAILGEMDPKKMQEILNKCSRHRDYHYNVVDTPPGYWKPYLTATMDSMSTSRQDDETFLDE